MKQYIWPSETAPCWKLPLIHVKFSKQNWSNLPSHFTKWSLLSIRERLHVFQAGWLCWFPEQLGARWLNGCTSVGKKRQKLVFLRQSGRFCQDLTYQTSNLNRWLKHVTFGKIFSEYFLWCLALKEHTTNTLINEYLLLDRLPERLYHWPEALWQLT